MKYLTLLLFILTTGCAAQPKNVTKQTLGSFVLSNVNIVNVKKERIEPNKNVVVENGKIVSINPYSTSTDDTSLPVIDGQGGYITPGLIDMHVHMYEKAAYQLALSHGVTHVRIMNGVPAQLRWRDEIDSQQWLGSTSSVSSPIISGYQNAPLHHTVQNAEEAKQAVSLYHQQGYDLIKAYGNLTPDSLQAIVEEGKRLNMPVAKHGPHASGDMHVSTLTGFQSFEHAEDIYQGPLNYQFSPEKLPAIISEIEKTKVPVTPTLNIFYQLTRISQDKEAYLEQTNQEYTSDIIALETKMNQTKRWLSASENMAKHNQKTLDFLLLITKIFDDLGVELLVGSDSGVLLSPHGIATHTEMELFLKAGISPYTTLAAATINPAKALGLNDQLGSIEKGYNADFIYSLSNPIEDLVVLKFPDAVVKQGNWINKKALEELREDAIESRSLWQEMKVLFEAM